MYVELERLNLPNFQFKFDDSDGILKIYDTIRNKFIVLTPEEWVRQNFVRYLNETLCYPKSRTKIEHNLKYGELNKRCDIIIYDKSAKPHIIVECKAYSIKLSQLTVNQLATYNSQLGSKYLCITNGIEHYYYVLNPTTNKYDSIKSFINYNDN
ncbi:MAG: type I restriction enzyme HsdR N-terminal domain-containing protein [Desulfobulbaceae bacterium]|nr:type I restriction enzyme HsdR N-terminal domain-containing protein [Candidatus Kapabacteria bacterium]MBS3999013.1 type I restriction enzyme HsdR N-terminal domain-containing protein [Desulfobulbaceae bacterium]